MSPSRDVCARRSNSWLKAWLLSAGLLLGVAQPLVAREAPLEPFAETEVFEAGGAVGILTLPAGAPDRRTPVIVILQDGAAPDGRAGPYIEQLLGAEFAVLEMLHLPDDSLDGVFTTLMQHARLAGQPLGLLGFGAGARLVASIATPVAARGLLYPGCGGMAPAAMPGQAVLLMHGGADPANPPQSCEALSAALAQAGAAVRLRVLAHASYAWDHPTFGSERHAMLPRPDGQGRVRAEPWPAMTQLSAAEVAGFFAASLLGQRR